jgi:hypothetical protein
MLFQRLIRRLFRIRIAPTAEDQPLPAAESIKARGWRQWSCVARADIPWVRDGASHAGSGNGTDGTRLLVVTQSCDLVHPDYGNEPVVEIFRCESLGLDREHRKRIERLLGEVARAFEETDGIASCDYQVQDEEQASLNLLRTHRLFPLDFLSLGDKSGGDLPPLA